MNVIEKKQPPIASFSISIHSVKDATWQGIVECSGKQRTFETEVQLLKYMMEFVPELKPDVSWITK